MKPSRRHFLKASGVSLALPWLNAFFPRGALAADAAKPVRRMVCICTPLGLHPSYFFPEKDGQGLRAQRPTWKSSRISAATTLSFPGLSHAGMSPGFAHQASASFLTGRAGAGRPGFRNAISLDQFAAEHIGGRTRFPSLALSGEGAGLSWTRTGALVPLPRRRQKCSPNCSSTADPKKSRPR